MSARNGSGGFVAPMVPAIAVAVVLAVSCARPVPRTTITNPANVEVAQLWVEPADIAERDLFHGPGGPEAAPDSAAVFELIKVDASGYSKGYDVREPDGSEWSVKLGLEAQPEVVTSRVLWAIGYHQLPTYFLPQWTMVGKQSGQQAAARFRPKLDDRKVVSDWSWYENEFVAAQAFRGLIVANLMLNSWDWKTSNNKIYEIRAADGDAPRREYVVRDLGASLGKTTFPTILKWMPMRGFGQGTRNDLPGFEKQGFIKHVKGNRVEFDYRGIHRPLVEMITIDDVVWTCRLMSKLSDQQWHDAFRAAGYTDDHRRRYVRKLKSKIAEGLALRIRTEN